jgi:MSHA biogenesis protein MshO
MHRTRLNRVAWRQRGFTLIEMVVSMVVVAIILAATLFFAYPVRQAVDVTTRAELTDIADNALHRIGFDVRLALPNSVRTTASGASSFVEFLPLRTGGRYRGESSGAACDTATDELAFDVADTCLKSIGTIPDPGTVTANDFLVLNNYGAGFARQDAYEAAAGTVNRRRIVSVVSEGARERITFLSGTFDRTLHDSAGKRFYIVAGNAATGLPEPVTYDCTPPTLVRRWGYTMTAAQPTSFGDGTSALLANNVLTCSFAYTPNVAPQVGLLTLQLVLSKATSGGSETVSLYHAVHVSNLP